MDSGLWVSVIQQQEYHEEMAGETYHKQFQKILPNLDCFIVMETCLTTAKTEVYLKHLGTKRVF
jgi:hypothetical protein